MANWRNITKKIKASPRTLKEAKKTAKKVLDEEKAKLLSEFNNHPVTQEIEMGPLAPNISNTLKLSCTSLQPHICIEPFLNNLTLIFFLLNFEYIINVN